MVFVSQILFAAAAQGNTRAIKQCIDKGVDVNAKNKSITAVFCASQYGHYKAVELLFNNGADLNIQDGHGWTPLMFASQHGHELCVLTLIAAGVDVAITTTDCASALIVAVQRHHFQVCKHIVAALKTSKTDTDEAICNAFIWAITTNQYDLFEMLMNNGASVNVGYQHSNDTGTALILACRLGHTRMVQKMIEAGADTEFAPFGKSPMDEATPEIKIILKRSERIKQTKSK